MDGTVSTHEPKVTCTQVYSLFSARATPQMEVPDTNGTIFPFPIDLLPTQIKKFKNILRVHAGAPSAQTASRNGHTDGRDTPENPYTM